MPMVGPDDETRATRTSHTAAPLTATIITNDDTNNQHQTRLRATSYLYLSTT